MFRQTGMDTAVRRADGTPWGALASLFAGLLYGISPIDLIPDVILILGWMDDAVAVPTFLVFAGVLYARHRKAMRARGGNSGVVRGESGEPVIPVEFESVRG